MVQYYTLIFLTKDDKVLLGYKKRGLGEKLWNGFGGKVEINEKVEECAVRELYEECGLRVNQRDLIYLGYVHYVQNDMERIVYIYTSENFSGTLQESEEMRPLWFAFSEVPYGYMWPDSKKWMDLVFTKCFIKCHFEYSSDGIIEKDSVCVLCAPPPMIGINNNNHRVDHNYKTIL